MSTVWRSLQWSLCSTSTQRWSGPIYASFKRHQCWRYHTQSCKRPQDSISSAGTSKWNCKQIKHSSWKPNKFNNHWKSGKHSVKGSMNHKITLKRHKTYSNKMIMQLSKLLWTTLSRRIATASIWMIWRIGEWNDWNLIRNKTFKLSNFQKIVQHADFLPSLPLVVPLLPLPLPLLVSLGSYFLEESLGSLLTTAA